MTIVAQLILFTGSVAFESVEFRFCLRPVIDRWYTCTYCEHGTQMCGRQGREENFSRAPQRSADEVTGEERSWKTIMMILNFISGQRRSRVLLACVYVVIAYSAAGGKVKANILAL